MNARITRYGSGNLGLVVNGIRILLTVSDGQAEAAAALAESIAALGPEGIAKVELPVAPAPPQWPAPERRQFSLGQSVWCTVHAVKGWRTVTAINPKDGRIKIDGGRVWCPLHNFEVEQPSWQS
jgi:hypothetical protein